MSGIDAKRRKTTLRKVTIMTTGTRGDIQPFVAIGIALKKAGFAVRVMTQPSNTHATLLRDFGLEHVPFGIDIDRFMQEDEAARTSMETGDTISFFKCIAGTIENNTAASCRPFCDEFLAGGAEHRPDLLLVSYLNRYFGLYARHVLKIPTIEVKLQHWVFDDPTRAPMGMPTLPLGMHKLIQTWLMVPQDYKNFLRFDSCIADIILSKEDRNTKTTSSLTDNRSSRTRLDEFLLYDQMLESEVNHSPLLPLLICQSPLFKDILHPTLPSSRNLRFIGSAIIDKSDQIGKDANSFGDDSERKEMQAFIASDAEKKPVYMGWGSMIRKSTKEMVIFAVEALMMSDKRGIIVGCSAKLNMKVLEDAVASGNAKNVDEGRRMIDYAKENVLFVAKAPHEWLFPQVSLTVHHGGAGTLNAALRAGVPTIVTPVFGDQYDNSFAVQNLGVGFGFDRQLQKIDAGDLSKAIDAVSNNPAMAMRAQEVGEKMRKECGATAVVDEVNRYWTEDVAAGRFSAEIEGWKSATKEMKTGTERKTLHSRIVFGCALAAAIIAFLIK